MILFTQISINNRIQMNKMLYHAIPADTGMGRAGTSEVPRTGPGPRRKIRTFVPFVFCDFLKMYTYVKKDICRLIPRPYTHEEALLICWFLIRTKDMEIRLWYEICIRHVSTPWQKQTILYIGKMKNNLELSSTYVHIIYILYIYTDKAN